MNKRFLLTTILLNIYLFASAQYPTYISSFPIAGPNNDNGKFIDLDATGNIYVAGTFGSVCDFDPSATQITMTPLGTSDIFIAKYSSSGILLWKYAISGTLESLAGMRVDDAGNAYIFGNYYTSLTASGLGSNATVSATGSADPYIAKYNTNGELKYLHSFEGGNSDAFSDVAIDNNTGEIYISGYFSSIQMDFDPGIGQVLLINTTPVGINSNPFIAKYDSSGNYIWAFNLKNMDSGNLNSLQLDASGRLVAGGYFSGTMVVDSANTSITAAAGGVDNVILRFTSAGIYDNSWTFGGTNSDYLVKVATTGNDIVAAGVFMGSADIDPGSGIVTVNSSGNNEIYLTKINENGVFQWGGSIKGSLSDYILGMTSNATGDIYVTGYFTFSASFDLTTNGGIQVAYAGTDGFVAKYSSTGTLITAMVLGSDGDDQCESIVHNGIGEFLVAGSFTNNPLYVNPAQTATIIANAGGSDAYVARYSDNLTVGLSSINSDEVKIYPVPAKESINIELKTPGKYSAKIMDVSGRIVSVNQNNFEQSTQFDTRSLVNGVYIVELKQADSNVAYYRFIKQ